MHLHLLDPWHCFSVFYISGFLPPFSPRMAVCSCLCPPAVLQSDPLAFFWWPHGHPGGVPVFQQNACHSVPPCVFCITSPCFPRDDSPPSSITTGGSCSALSGIRALGPGDNDRSCAVMYCAGASQLYVRFRPFGTRWGDKTLPLQHSHAAGAPWDMMRHRTLTGISLSFTEDYCSFLFLCICHDLAPGCLYL